MASEIDPFFDQAAFMFACGQQTVAPDPEQAAMYRALIEEERAEWLDATPGSVDDLDAVIDQIVVLIGYGVSRGWNLRGAWAEVMRSNFDKVGDDGFVRKRADGKILKPEGWKPPDLVPYTEVQR